MSSSSETVYLSLAEIYRQLRRELLIDRTELPVITLPALSTRAETSRLIADSLQQDQTSVWLSSKEEREKRRQRLHRLATSHPDANLRESGSSPAPPQSLVLSNENIRPIRVGPDIPAPQVPERSSPLVREQLAKLAKNARFNPDLGRDPYPLLLPAHSYESYLAQVLGGLRLEVLDADEEDETTVYKLQGQQMLWDTGAHFTTITEDLVPESFLMHTRDTGYLETYGTAANSGVVQIGIEVQFSNCLHKIEGLATIRPANTMPNGFSGIILGQWTILDSLEYHVVPARILQARNEVAHGDWGEIRLLGCVVDGQYKAY
ncbi:hypothetical protein GP486_002520 [Trichoglossum hirsutum]|uniref:Peptidase A2 domain-containing protein n=1 Tax=Trichoglossum hirsutum TaxID=265104 RepID=A0A9P8LF24_9PEZI|nr:hypothetical protein GP486_002520 [Trichoglossum hirsutum]